MSFELSAADICCNWNGSFSTPTDWQRRNSCCQRCCVYCIWDNTSCCLLTGEYDGSWWWRGWCYHLDMPVPKQTSKHGYTKNGHTKLLSLNIVHIRYTANYSRQI